MGVSVPTILMNFSGVYNLECFTPEDSILLDFTKMEGVNCYCDDEAEAEITSRLEPYGYSGIHWLDSGDYHYLSLFWLRKIDRPFALVLFDHHPDDQSASFDASILSCGSWVNNAKELPNMKDFLYVRSLEDIRAIPKDLPVYFSIDKDVLSREFASTDWDQGTMSLDHLVKAILEISSEHEVLGADVCGEISEAKGAVDNDLITNAHTNRRLQLLLLNLLCKN